MSANNPTCVFVDGVCSCGATVPPGVTLPFYRQCRLHVPPKPPLLGNKVEAFLTKHGVTERTYRNLKVFVGLSDTCNCIGRKEALNTLHQSVVEGLSHLKEGDFQELAECVGHSVHSIRKKLFPPQKS